MANTYRGLGKIGLQDDEEFVDILEDKRHCSDLSFAFRTFSPPPYKGAAPCSTAELNTAVLESQYLRYVIGEVAGETGSSEEEVRGEARRTLGEMSQNLQLRFIRLMAFTLRKVFKRLFSAIYVNIEGLNAKGFAPLEFFVEGLRSRTLKSLPPKLGMMHMILEPFFKGEVFDVTLLPISISYDRVLEESLLAHELLGVPKPRESTTGLLKATKVLQENYGCMHVNFGRPLSVRRLCEGKINRCQYNHMPRDLPQKPNAEAQACGSWLAHLMVRVQEEGSLTSPWSLMACVLLQVPTAALTEEGLLFHQLTEQTLWLRKLALEFGAHLSWPEKASDPDVMSSAVALHRSVVYRKAGRVYLFLADESERKHPLSPEEDAMRTATALLMLASYRNQSLHVFVRPALLALAVSVTKSTQRDELLTCFCFLQDVFANEFIFIPGRSSEDFEEACSLLKKCKAVHVSQREVTVSDAGPEVLPFLQELLRPFVDSYQLMFRFLCEERDCVFTEKEFLPAVRAFATKLIVSGELPTYEALSSDVQKNVLSALLRLGAVTKIKTSENNQYKVNKTAVRRTGDMLAGRIPPQIAQAAPDARL
ncbi:dihydroxyacetone phosphate acyltransferase-like isoform 1-T1 [Fundulus diaphanus]